MRRFPMLVLTVVAVLFAASSASAQVFGTFSWQMQPYCNVVTMTLTSVTGNFTLDGTDDQCGAATKGAVHGIGVFNPNGSVGLNFTSISSPSGKAEQVSAIVDPGTGGGTWTSSTGAAGTFAFFGNSAGLPARPGPVAQFRVGALTSQAMAASSIIVAKWSATPIDNIGGGTYDAAAGTYTVPTAGVYMVTALARFQVFTAATGYACIGITVNGSNRGTACEPPSTSASFHIMSISTAVTVSAGDAVAVRALNFSGGTSTLGPSGDSFFTVTRVP